MGSSPLGPAGPYPWSPSGGGRAASARAVQERPQRQRTPESFKGRVVIVTGGATGLGRAVAMEFAQNGCGVAFNYVEMPGREVGPQALLTETAIKACGVPCYSALCDVREMDLVEHFVSEVRSKLGGVHYLVNNAGVTHDGALWRLTPEAWSEVIDTNVTGAFNCIHAVAPLMRAQRFGKIVNVASHQAFRPGFGIANYAASKAALIGLTKAAAVDLGSAGINVNAVAPGFVKTELLTQLPREVLERAEHESVLGRVAEPEDVSRVILFLCSEAARHITGQVIVVDGGLSLARRRRRSRPYGLPLSACVEHHLYPGSAAVSTAYADGSRGRPLRARAGGPRIPGGEPRGRAPGITGRCISRAFGRSHRLACRQGRVAHHRAR